MPNRFTAIPDGQPPAFPEWFDKTLVPLADLPRQHIG
jgi:hypothetical protein